MRSTPARILMALLGVALALAAWRFWPQTRPLSPDELAEIALHGATVDQQTAAAIKLADYGDAALPALRRVLDETERPEVTALCLQGLAKLWDYDSMDHFLDLAENGPPRVRGRAAQVVMRMTGRQRPYFASAPDAQRRLLVSHMRADWKEIQAATPKAREELKRRLRESEAKRL